MQVAGQYLVKHALFDKFIHEAPDTGLSVIIVIPCCNEPDIILTLESLAKCNGPETAAEVIIVINSSEKAGNEIIETNRLANDKINRWINVNNSQRLRFYTVFIENIPAKDAGVGFARKAGMDEAVRRFDAVGNSHGVIAGLDADCTVAQNYLSEIEKTFRLNPGINAASIEFEHPVEGNVFSQLVYDSIIEYEIHLRYYITMLKVAGHPFAFQTIGSAFAVRCGVYCRQGGMNRRKAGEDFYFLQKVIPLGGYAEINSTKIFPSPRPSLRVPFGTGAAVKKMEETGEALYLTYSFEAFRDIAQLISNLKNFYNTGQSDYSNITTTFPAVLVSFLDSWNFYNKLSEMKSNSSSLSSFTKRFFSNFNMFAVLKYMNYSHVNCYKKNSASSEANRVLVEAGVIREAVTPEKLLFYFRDVNKNIQLLG